MSSLVETQGVKSREPYCLGVCRKVLTVKISMRQYRAKNDISSIKLGGFMKDIPRFNGLYSATEDGKIYSQ